MKRNLIVVSLLVVALAAMQIAPPAQAEPITLTIVAIAGLTTVMTAAGADMAAHREHIVQANSPQEKPAEIYASDRPADASNHPGGSATTAR